MMVSPLHLQAEKRCFVGFEAGPSAGLHNLAL